MNDAFTFIDGSDESADVVASLEYSGELSDTELRDALEERIEEITSHLSDFPKTLTMQNQGLFALGYYHQRAANRAAAKSAIASKKIQESN